MVNKRLIGFLFAFVIGSLSLQAGSDRDPLPHPLTLQEAESYAIRHNKSINALRDRVLQGEFRQREARSFWLPSIDLSGKIEGDDSGDETFSQKATVNQIIYSSSAYYRLPRSDILARLDEVGLVTAINQLLFDVRSKYYEIVLAQEDVEVARENVELLADGVRGEKRRWDVGESTRFNVDQSKVTVANALSDYYLTLRRLKVARNDLLELLGLDTCEEDDLFLDQKEIPVLSVKDLAEKIEEFGLPSLENTTVDSLKESFHITSEGVMPENRLFTDEEMWAWEDRALNYRPEIVAACLFKRLAEVDLCDRIGEWHPKVTAFGCVDHESTNRLSFSSGDVGWKGGISVNWTLFDGFGRDLRICDAKTGVHAASIRYDEQVQIAKLAVRDRFFEMEESLLSYFAAKQGVHLAEEAVNLAVNQRNMGIITPLEYRDATQTLTEARQNFNRASFSLLRSYYALRRDAGVDVRV